MDVYVITGGIKLKPYHMIFNMLKKTTYVNTKNNIWEQEKQYYNEIL